MTRVASLVFGALVVLGLAGCPHSLSVKTMTTPNAHIEKYSTFAIGQEEKPPKAYDATAGADEIRVQVEQLVVGEMGAKGYVSGAAPADLTVRVSSGVRQVETTSAAHGAPNGMSGGGDELETEKDETHGYIRVYVYDTKTNGLLWRGSAQTLAAAKEEDPKRLREAIHRMFEEFPLKAK